MKTRAFIYVRVSSQRQVEEGHGLEGQEKRCRDYSKAQGYEVVGVFKDEGVSGGIIDREGMQTLLNVLEQYKDMPDESVVIIDDIKRLAREIQGHFTLKTAIYTRNARLESPSHRFEDSPEGKFVETVLAGAAELERNQNRRQVINRMKARLEAGYWPFCMPLGLINEKHSLHGRILVRREPYATIYKEGIEKYRDGILPTIDAFQLFVNGKYKEHGISHVMAHGTATNTLKDILYTGYIEYPKWNIPRMKAKHDGFITIETYDIVQARLQGRAKIWHRKDYHLDFPLRPYVLCDSCGVSMSGSYNTGRRERYPHYYCRGKGCKYIWKTTAKAAFESKFEALLSSVKPADELVDLTRDVLLEVWNTRLETYSLGRNNAQSELEEIKKEIDDYVKLVSKAQDDVLRGVYEEKIKELVGKKGQLEQKLKQNTYTNKDFGTASEKVFNTLKEPMDMWRSDDYSDKRTILFMYFEDKLRYNYETGFGTATLAYPISLITQKPPVKEASVEMSSFESRVQEIILKTSTSLFDF